MTAAFDTLLGLGVATMVACKLTGRSRATHYRRLRPPQARRPRSRKPTAPRPRRH